MIVAIMMGPPGNASTAYTYPLIVPPDRWPWTIGLVKLESGPLTGQAKGETREQS
jgi:hypothetical protein